MKSLTVSKRFDGTWTIKATGSTKPISLHKTMDEAIEVAKQKLAKKGGELLLKVNYQTTTVAVIAQL